MLLQLLNLLAALHDLVHVMQCLVGAGFEWALHSQCIQCHAHHRDGGFQFMCEHENKAALLVFLGALQPQLLLSQLQVRLGGLTQLLLLVRAQVQYGKHQNAANQTVNQQGEEVPFGGLHQAQQRQ